MECVHGGTDETKDKARVIAKELKLPIYATRGTAEMLSEIGIMCTMLKKQSGGERSAVDLIEGGEVDLVINIPRDYDAFGRPDGLLIRRAAVDAGVPLITDLQLARAVIEALRTKKPGDLQVLAWQDYVSREPAVLLSELQRAHSIHQRV